MPRSITRFRPALQPIGPAFHAGVLALVHTFLPLLMRFRLFPWLPAGISGIDVEGGEELARCFHRFGAGEIRLILAIRHCEVDDPLCALQLLSRQMPRDAARLGLSLPRPCHAHFMFDRGMPLWGGRPLGWVLSWLGGVSIRRGRRPDWKALRQARELVLNGRFPFGVAPEGATNGHGEVIGPLEPGVAQLGLWCVQDLRRSGRQEEVVILPISLRYIYRKAQWWRLARLMAQLERTIGLETATLGSSPVPPGPADFYSRLLRIGEALLERLERFYGRYSEGPLPGQAMDNGSAADLGGRIQRLVERALAVSEANLGLRAAGSPVDRCRRIEEAVWRRTYPDELPPRHRLSPLDRGLADRAAQEAALADVHMRLAESFVAVSGSYVAERPSFERFMETTLLIHDALGRLHGEGLPCRPHLGARRARIKVGAPLTVNDRYAISGAGEAEGITAADTCPDIAADRAERAVRRGSRQLVANLNEAIRLSFETALE